MAKLWQNWIKKNNKNIYKKKLVKLPTPQYAVFYNGSEDAEDVSELYLSNAFEKPIKDGKYEWTAKVYNINFGKNKELMERCKALREYAHFVQMVRTYYKECKDETESIKKAMQEAINRNYLDGYFEKEKEEVFMTTLFEIDKDIYENDLREEGKVEIIIAMYQSGMPIKQISSIVKMDIKELEKLVVDWDKSYNL